MSLRSSSFITLTIITEDRTFISRGGFDYSDDYLANALINNNRGLLNDKISTIQQIFDVLYKAYGDNINGLDIDISNFADLEDFSKINEIIIEDEVSGDLAYFKLEMELGIDSDSNIKIVEKYNFKTKEHSVKKYVQNYDGNWQSLDGKETIKENPSNLANNKHTVIPNGKTNIGAYAFYECKNLESIIIPDSVESIGEGAFRDCINLTSITIPNGVASIAIGEDAFKGCTKLERIEIIGTEIILGKNAFYGCSNLSEFIAHTKNIRVGRDCFNGCKNLTDDGFIIINFLNDKIMCGYEGSKDVKAIKIPMGVTQIMGCYESLEELQTIIFSDTVKEIGDFTFFRCEKLEKLIIPQKSTQIKLFAFPRRPNELFPNRCSNLIIYAPKDSYAEQYAKKRDIPFEEI